MAAVRMARKVPLLKVKFRGHLSLFLEKVVCVCVSVCGFLLFFSSRATLEIQDFTLLMTMISCTSSSPAKLGNTLIW